MTSLRMTIPVAGKTPPTAKLSFIPSFERDRSYKWWLPNPLNVLRENGHQSYSVEAYSSTCRTLLGECDNHFLAQIRGEDKKLRDISQATEVTPYENGLVGLEANTLAAWEHQALTEDYRFFDARWVNFIYKESAQACSILADEASAVIVNSGGLPLDPLLLAFMYRQSSREMESLLAFDQPPCLRSRLVLPGARIRYGKDGQAMTAVPIVGLEEKSERGTRLTLSSYGGYKPPWHSVWEDAAMLALFPID